MDFNFKKLASDASQVFSRAKQFTEEKIGRADKTELDADLEQLLARADRTRFHTETLLSNAEAVIQPNIGHRLEDMVTEKLGHGRNRPTDHETLGDGMMQAGEEFGTLTTYGSLLIKVGQREKIIGQVEREFIDTSTSLWVRPLRSFLDGDMKILQQERRELENKRLDLDACKNRLKRARCQQYSPQKDLTKDSTAAIQMADLLMEAEHDLQAAQVLFDRQCEVVRQVLDTIRGAQAYHAKCLEELVRSQTQYHGRCGQILAELQQQLGIASASDAATGGAAGNGSIPGRPADGQSALLASGADDGMTGVFGI